MTLMNYVSANSRMYTAEQWLRYTEALGLTITDVHTPLSAEEEAIINVNLSRMNQLIGRSKSKTGSVSTADKIAASKHNLETLLSDYTVLLDPETPYLSAFFENALPLLRAKGCRINMVCSSLVQLRSQSKNAADEEERRLAAESYHTLVRLVQEGVVILLKDPAADASPQQNLFTSAAQNRLHHNLLVITRDKELAKTALFLNEQLSCQSSYTVAVRQLNQHGYLSNHFFKKEKPVTSPPALAKEAATPRTVDEVLPLDSVPVKGDRVFSRSGSIVLTDILSDKGGEAVIYYTSCEGMVAKIYRSGFHTLFRKEKIERLISADLHYVGICFPVSVLTNEKGQFCGYLMQEAKGTTMNSVFSRRSFLKAFPDWTRIELVTALLHLLYAIRYLHSKGILLGDINANNVLFCSPEEVYIVDLESAQICGLPCPVGVPAFTPPELLSKMQSGEVNGYGEVLRDEKMEDFSVAVLLFKALMGGKSPYVAVGSIDETASILRGHFPYPLGEKRSNGVPQGHWKNLWSQLTFEMKSSFHACFSSEEGKGEWNRDGRLSVSEWIKRLQTYLIILTKWKEEMDHMEAQGVTPNEFWTLPDSVLRKKLGESFSRKDFEKFPDPASLDVFPEHTKRRGGFRYGLCKECGEDLPIESMDNGYCRACQNDMKHRGENVPCLAYGCSNSVLYSDHRRLVLKKNRPLMCSACYDRRNEVALSHKCKNQFCHTFINATVNQTAVWALQGFSAEAAIPKYCAACKVPVPVDPVEPVIPVVPETPVVPEIPVVHETPVPEETVVVHEKPVAPKKPPVEQPGREREEARRNFIERLLRILHA